MPTKPHRKKGTAYLDEAVAKSTYHEKQISKRRALIAGLCAFPFGFTGLHNYLMRRKKRAFAHFVISGVALLMFFYPFLIAVKNYMSCRKGLECEDLSQFSVLFNILVIAGIVTFAASFIWAIVEGIVILTHLRRFEK